MFDYSKVRYSVVTARRAQLLGLRPDRHYGYYVLSDVVMPAHRSRIAAWCKTKQIAHRHLTQHDEAVRQGYYGCNCGSGKQRRACCGQ